MRPFAAANQGTRSNRTSAVSFTYSKESFGSVNFNYLSSASKQKITTFIPTQDRKYIQAAYIK